MRLVPILFLFSLFPPVLAITERGVIAYTLEDYVAYGMGLLFILTGCAILYMTLK